MAQNDGEHKDGQPDHGGREADAPAGEGGAATKALSELAKAVPGLGWLLDVAGASPALRERLAKADKEVEKRLRRGGGAPFFRVVYGYRIRQLAEDDG